MCNHFRWEDPKQVLELAGLWAEITEENRWELLHEAWPKRPAAVIYQRERKTLAAMRWGVWPYYEKSMPSRLPHDARDDALLTKSIWKRAAARGRCLVPTDCFFEWAGPPKLKFEVLFQRADRRPFFIAGIWTRDPVGEGRGFAIVTTKPNEVVAAVPHQRMPVILDETTAAAWLGEQPLPPEQLQALCAPYPAERMSRRDLPRIERSHSTIELEPMQQGELF